MATRETTLRFIDERMKDLGNLPVFSASVYRVRKVSADPESSAFALTKEIEQDANLTARILSLANSSYYNGGNGRVGTISRAIVVLGFETIGNICLTLKLIESIQGANSAVDMNRMLVRVYLSAVFVREIAIRIGIKDIEEAYTCALLHNLGEIVAAYFLPDQYLQIRQVHQERGQNRKAIEQETLGLTFEDIGESLAESWGFPPGITGTMRHFDPESCKPGMKGITLRRALASLGCASIGALYGDASGAEHNLSRLMDRFSEAAGLDPGVAQNDLIESVKKSCAMAQDYGVKSEVLMPEPATGADEFRDRLAGKISYLAGNHRPAPEVAQEADSQQETDPQKDAGDQHGAADEKSPDVALQMEILQETSQMLVSGTKLNNVLTRIIEGLHQAVMFDRVALILISPDRSAYSVRMTVGEDTQPLRDCLCRPILPEQDLLSKILLEGDELSVDDCDDPSWRPLLAEEFTRHSGAQAFLLGTLRNNERPIGLFYADNANSGQPICEAQRQGFRRFRTQAHLAIRLGNHP